MLSNSIEKSYFITLDSKKPFLIIQNDEDVSEIHYFYNNQFRPISILRTVTGTHYLDLRELAYKHDGKTLTLRVKFKQKNSPDIELKYKLASEDELKTEKNPIEEVKKLLSNFFKSALFFTIVGLLIIIVLAIVIITFKKIVIRTASSIPDLLTERDKEISQLPTTLQKEIIPLEKIKDLTKNYLVEKLIDYDINDVEKFRMREFYDSNGIRHLLRLAYLKPERRFIAVSILHPYDCPKVRNTIEYYSWKEILRHVNNERLKKGKKSILITKPESFKI